MTAGLMFPKETRLKKPSWDSLYARFRAYLKRRYEGQTCQVRHEGCSGVWSEWAHYVGRAKDMLRCHPLNGLRACPVCHKWCDGAKEERMRPVMVEVYGIEVVENLELIKRTTYSDQESRQFFAKWWALACGAGEENNGNG